jgi:hypothetical protein
MIHQLDYIIAKEQSIKIKPGTENTPHSHIQRHDNMFIKVVDLTNTIHSNQTGAFPFYLTTQQQVHNGCNPH